MAANILQIEEIVSDPNVRGGRPVIAGTGITVMNIVLAHTTGDELSAEQIASHYGLGLGQVYAALAYYYLHQDEIDNEMRRDDAEAERLKEELKKMGRLIEL